MTTSFITGAHIPRRTFVRGMGATVALPLLDAMMPAGPGRWGRAAARGARISVKSRFSCAMSSGSSGTDELYAIRLP